MADITPAKNTIQIEETKVKASISEATMTRIGASINYIIERIYQRLPFTWNGYYKVGDLSDGLNGIVYFYRQTEIAAYTLTNDVAGTAGSSEINFVVYDETNTELGDLFTTPPSLSFSAGNRSVIGRDVENAVDIEPDTGKVVGTLNYTSFPAGYSIKPKITQAQSNGRNLRFDLYLKES